MAATLKHWRESASLILLSSSKLSNLNFQLVSSAGQHGHKGARPENYDVLLMKRSSKSKFMPNVYVFPGGVAVNSDFNFCWLNLYKKLGLSVQKSIFEVMTSGSSLAAPMFSRKRDAEFSSIPAEVAFRICAIRETFEESGVLLAWPVKQATAVGPAIMSPEKVGTNDSLFDLDIDSNRISAWRDRVNADPDEFFNMCQELDLVPAIWSLYEWSDWLTPAMAVENRRRFDTAFYVCCVDHKPDILEDKGETVNAQWVSPSSALQQHYSKGGGLAPPQVYELSRLLNFRTMEALRSNAADPSRERVERLYPVTCVCDDHVMGLLPGDNYYPPDRDLITRDPLQVNKPLSEMQDGAHRTCMVRDTNYASGGICLVQCSIDQRRKGNVLPDIQAVNGIMMKAKL